MLFMAPFRRGGRRVTRHRGRGVGAVDAILTAATAIALVSLAGCGRRPPTVAATHVTRIDRFVEAVDLVSRRQGWLLAEQVNVPSGDVTSVTLYHTTEGFHRWHVVARYPKQLVGQLVFTSPERGVALTLRGATLGYFNYQIWRITDGGKTWHQAARITLPAGPAVLAFWNPTHGLIVGGPGGGSYAMVSVTRDGGRRWTTVDRLAPSPLGIGGALGATTATLRSAQDGFVVNGYSPWPDPKEPPIPVLQAFVTRTGGQTWRRVSIPTHGLRGAVAAVSFSSLATGWMALSSMKRNTTVIEGTADQGRHWHVLWRIPPALTTGGVSVDQVTAHVGCVVLQKALRCTDNGGHAWYAAHL